MGNTVNRDAKDGQFVSDEEAKTNPSTTVTETVKKSDEKPKKEEVKKDKKVKSYFFKNIRYSALKVLVRGGKDDLGGEGVLETARFMPFYDTWKGDTVRVGYLKTESEKVADRCREDSTCEEIDEKEYTQAVEGDDKHKPLNRAPIPTA